MIQVASLVSVICALVFDKHRTGLEPEVAPSGAVQTFGQALWPAPTQHICRGGPPWPPIAAQNIELHPAPSICLTRGRFLCDNYREEND